MRFNHYEDTSYEDAVEYLTDHPDEIGKAWSSPLDVRGGSLFAFVSKDGTNEGDDLIFCLTMIRASHNGNFHCDTRCSPEMTEAIREDPRLPFRCADITVESLPVFSEWQRRLDHEFQDKEV